jgi:uncharacterized protein (DUF1330 family)
MPAYWVGRARVIDATAYKQYAELAPGIIARHGGRFLARGGTSQVLEGPAKFDRFVIIEFPTLEAGAACFNSPEYRAAAAFRRNGAGEVESFIVEAVD